MNSKLTFVCGGLFLLLLRLLVASHSHSGQNSPPLFGDYEAQRHWMEITLSLPADEWYRDTPRNDLLYWGLDYPPLSAYFSLVVGKMISFIEPEAMELFQSRGYVTVSSKLLLRVSVIISELIFFVPSVYLAISSFEKGKTKPQLAWLLFGILLQPSQLLIDHGHFQYNCVSLGLSIAAVGFAFRKQFVLTSIFFTMSLNYKIMSLYYAPAFFFYLISVSFDEESGFKRVLKGVWRIAKMALTAILTTVICWLEFFLNGTHKDVLHRCFPVARGLYEDKVANFWCSVSPVFKMKLWEASPAIRVCLFTTLVSILPTCYALWKRPTKKNLLLGLTSISLGYFMFSYHVHEKSILIPLAPLALLMEQHPLLVFHASLIGVFSMFPLLAKDGLSLAYINMTLLFSIFMFPGKQKYTQTQFLFLVVSVVGCILLHAINFIIVPPSRFPDLFTLALTSYSFFHFFGVYLYINYLLFQTPTKFKTQ